MYMRAKVKNKKRQLDYGISVFRVCSHSIAISPTQGLSKWTLDIFLKNTRDLVYKSCTE